MTKTVDSFKGEYAYLSNFSLYSFIDREGHLWKSVEHYYQAMKTIDEVWREKVKAAKTAAEAKRLGRKCPHRSNWEHMKIEVMTDALCYKFNQNLEIRQKLIDTGIDELIEGNNWGDVYWGQVNGVGQNWLGVLLMNLRNRLRSGII